MGLRLGFYALIAIVGFVTAGLGLISQNSQGQGTGPASVIAAPLASDNGNGDAEPVAAGPVAAKAAGSIGCAPAFTDTIIGSADGRIRVQVFKTMPRSIRITIVTPIDPNTITAPSIGQKVDALVFQIVADDCGDGIVGAVSPGPGMLPAEVNLGVHYSPGDVGTLNEAKFALAWLDPETNTWKALPKTAPDPDDNYVSATISNAGIFMVYQTP